MEKSSVSSASVRYALQVILGPDKGKAFKLAKDTVSIGRAPGNDIVLTDRAVSQKHAAITVSDFGCTLKDVGSRYGTGLNGKKIAAEQPLKDGDEIIVGNTKLRFRDLSRKTRPTSPPPASAAPARPSRPEAPAPAEPEAIAAEDLADLDAQAADYIEDERPPILPFVLPGAIILLLLIVGGWGWKKMRENEGVREGPRNYLAPNASFEQSAPGAASPQGWEPRGDAYRWAVQAAEDGKFVAAQPAGAAATLSHAALARRRVVEVGENVGFLVSGWVRTGQGAGLAGLRVRWTGEASDAVVLDQFVGVTPGGRDWREFSAVLPIPLGAKHLQVSCEVFGNVKEAAFDELALHDQNALEKSPKRLVVEYPDAVSVNPTSLGVLNVLRSHALALRNGEAALTNAGPAGFARQALAEPLDKYPFIDDETNSIVFGGRIWTPIPGGAVPVEFEQRVTPQTDGVAVAYVFRRPAQAARVVPGVAFRLAPGLAEQPAITLAGKSYAARNVGFDLKDGQEVIWGAPAKALVVAFDKPGRLRLAEEELSYQLPPQELKPDGSIELRFLLTDQSPHRGEVMNAALAQMKERMSKGEWAAALNQGNALAQLPVFSPEQQSELQKRIAAIVEKVDAKVKAIREQLAAADRSGGAQDLMKVRQEIDALRGRLKGCPQEVKAKRLADALEAVRRRRAAEMEKAAQAYMERARARRAKGPLLLARIYVENVLRQFPRTQTAKKAAALLEQIKKELAREQAKQAWLEAKLAEGENYVHNKRLDKAKAAFQEIIDKYPDSPFADKAKKRLAELAAAGK